MYKVGDLFAGIGGVALGFKQAGMEVLWANEYDHHACICPTLTANMGTGGHNVPLIRDRKDIRKLTPRECIRFQGFPDTYKLPEGKLPKSALYKQAGINSMYYRAK